MRTCNCRDGALIIKATPGSAMKISGIDEFTGLELATFIMVAGTCAGLAASEVKAGVDKNKTDIINKKNIKLILWLIMGRFLLLFAFTQQRSRRPLCRGASPIYNYRSSGETND